MGILSGIFNVLLILTSVFLICLVLIQRGKGGGLAGAFGGVGGSSAFGTKAGDVFTRVTMYTAGAWFAMAMILVFLSNRGVADSAWGDEPPSSATSKQSSTSRPKSSSSAPAAGLPASSSPLPAGAASSPAAPAPSGGIGTGAPDGLAPGAPTGVPGKTDPAIPPPAPAKTP